MQIILGKDFHMLTIILIPIRYVTTILKQVSNHAIYPLNIAPLVLNLFIQKQGANFFDKIPKFFKKNY